MSIKIAIQHKTSYTYDKPIKLWPQVLRLKPAPHCRTKIDSYALEILPKDHFINWMQDPFGNYQARIVFPELVQKFEFTVEVIAELIAINPFDFFLEEYAEIFPFTYAESLLKELKPYLEIEESGPYLQQLLAECEKYKNQNTVDFLVSVNQHIYEAIDYSVRLEVGVQSCEETLGRKIGSCRDSAWLLVQLLRHYGLATRFVSGYLVQLKADVLEKHGPSGPDEDFTDLHAWAEVYIPGAGWVGLDATSGLFASEGHIPLACTPHYRSAAPISGATQKAKVEFHFDNSVQRISESARVSKPYTPEQFEMMDRIGHQVDSVLSDADVKLTMGGEPTFVSKTDMESAQWNTDADGEDKRRLSYELTKKLRDKLASNAFIHFGQGKWYPGEPIPRWQYAMYWRNDGFPLWENLSWIADPNAPGNATIEDGERFLKVLMQNLGLDDSLIQPAYEDEYYYLWEKANLPINFDQDYDKDETKIERQALLDLLSKGIDKHIGFVVPLEYDAQHHHWLSTEWLFERNKLYLLPGNSQIGMRLPLDRLKINRSKISDQVIPANFFNDIYGLIQKNDVFEKIQKRKSLALKSSHQDIQTAMCLEIVHGQIHIFFPPFEDMNHFLDLLHTVELVAEQLQLPIIIEGYQPPYHPEVTKLVVAPDPGVVEVNVHPMKTWGEIREVYDILFELADEVGLSTNKYMLDGKHTGTGGGNHITLGGAKPAESPILRQPDTLRSMVNFWQNHPGLSYLFSSPFIGSTSQSPRVDEGRPEMLYELEIAFKELEKLENPPFWMVDRIFRNILTDITGNTHRSEFCIDKLYSPDSNTGRLGILEMRGFDMPPHKEMCFLQILLVRSLFATFWNTPYKHPVIHWGNDLHNKFMMHHFIKEDIYDVVEYLQNHGINFQKEWFDVFLDFRFPEYGSVQLNGIKLTLRSALEPWIVLGEEMSNSGTARFVDSSVERLEVVVEDFNPERYKLLCNSIVVPLVPTDYSRKYVASIRYKAWAPPSALHPTIGVDTPLVFDIYDTYNERAIGGCTYHVVHPGGRNYDTFPVNQLEAESRRSTRFNEMNHSPKKKTIISDQGDSQSSTNYIVINSSINSEVEVKSIPISKDFPHTLDLRRK